ncbi:hypothetical protein [Streptomyces sp. NPDC060194]|uniref:bestrophin-like domain n=1 Tax=Streptomyces sp. NPDC060194 TaxID=3347069 RepID=UPI00365C94E9
MWVYGALVVVAAFLCGAAAARLWHRFVGPRGSADGLPLLAASCGTVASLYVLTIAFLIVSATSSLGGARADAEAEAAALRQAYLAAGQLDPAERREVRGAVRAYADTVIDDEWPELARDKASREAWERLDGLNSLTYGVDSGSPRARDDVRQAVNTVYEQRRHRLAAAADRLPGILVAFLVVTAVVAPLYFLLAGWPSGVRATACLGVLCALFASGIWIVLQLNQPFGSGVRVSPASFQEALARMDQIDERPAVRR